MASSKTLSLLVDSIVIRFNFFKCVQSLMAQFFLGGGAKGSSCLKQMMHSLRRKRKRVQFFAEQASLSGKIFLWLR